MHNVALIFAGGTGRRMNTRTLPKQFLELHGKPIIIYTLEKFEQVDEIDSMVVVCLRGWHDHLRKLLRQYDIKKVEKIVDGGETGQDSIRNGVYSIAENWSRDTNVLIHDGVRPLIDTETIRKCISCVEQYGNAITIAPLTETVAISNDSPDVISEIVERKKCNVAKAPQCYLLGDLLEAEKKAEEDGIHTFIDTATMMNHYGYQLHTVVGNSSNIKITDPTDFYIFRAIVDAMENSQIFG